MSAIDSSPITDEKLRREQERFAKVQSLVRGIEATGGEAKGRYLHTNIKAKGMPTFGKAPYILLVVSPIGENPYFHLQTYEKPIKDQAEEDIFARMEEDLAETIDAPFFPVRRGSLGFYPDGVSEIRGQGNLGSASAIEAVSEIMKPAGSSFHV